MATVTAYWRPESTASALELLERTGAVVLGGGTTLTSRPPGDIEVVDLQALHLNGIEPLGGDSVHVGAMVTYHQLAASVVVPAVVRDAARHEEPSTLRVQATVGGCIATGDRESELLATLLVHDTVVHLADRDGVTEQPLEAVLAALPLAPATIVMGVTLATSGVAAVARAARTRADRPIVAAVVRDVDGRRRIALTGIAATPVLVDDLGDIDDLEPIADFRGSTEYRLALAHTLVARAGEVLR